MSRIELEVVLLHDRGERAGEHRLRRDVGHPPSAEPDLGLVLADALEVVRSATCPHLGDGSRIAAARDEESPTALSGQAMARAIRHLRAASRGSRGRLGDRYRTGCTVRGRQRGRSCQFSPPPSSS